MSDNNVLPRLVLVAITNPAVRALCCETLLTAGCAVADGVESGAAVVTMARERHPDVVILSEQLSDVPASEAIKWLRANSKSTVVPIIVLGGASNLAAADTHVVVLPRSATRAKLLETLTSVLPAMPSKTPTPTEHRI